MSEAVASAAEVKETPRFVRALKAMKDRRMAAMFLLALAAGLPYGAVLGTLNAWLTTEGVTPSEIGVLSLVTIGYAFKFLWSPAFQKASHPFPFLGPRRTWLFSLQLLIAALLFLLAFSNPGKNIGLVAFIALFAALASATHDIVLDAWRIEVARTEEDKDLMAALYQFGYRIAVFITGFLALLMAQYYGCRCLVMIAIVMVMSITGTMLAPEPEAPDAKGGARPVSNPAFRRASAACAAGCGRLDRSFPDDRLLRGLLRTQVCRRGAVHLSPSRARGLSASRSSFLRSAR